MHEMWKGIIVLCGCGCANIQDLICDCRLLCYTKFISAVLETYDLFMLCYCYVQYVTWVFLVTGIK